MALTYAALKAELQNDPKALGYAGKSPWQQSVLLNTVGLSSETVDVEFVEGWQIWEATVPAEWAALSTAERQRYQALLGMGQINVKGANTRAALLAMFAAGTQTRANLAALQTRSASRAEALFGAGVSVTDAQVAGALAS